VYYRLPDKWDTASGSYLGKDYGPVEMLFGLFLVDEKRTALDFISMIDVARQEIFSNKQKAREKPH
jgi:hypothetical protein